MKTILYTLSVLLATSRLLAQGTMLVDQQSFDLATGSTSTPVFGIGQSFTPSLTAIVYVQFGLADNPGSSLFVNLRQNSMSGPIIGTSDTQLIPSNAHIPTTFFFSSSVTLTPGTQYFLEPVVVVNESQIAVEISFPGTNPYPGGSALHGNIAGNYSLWFSEGIIVPEPSTWAISGLGLVVLLAVSSKRKRVPKVTATSGASTPKPTPRCSPI